MSAAIAAIANARLRGAQVTRSRVSPFVAYATEYRPDANERLLEWRTGPMPCRLPARYFSSGTFMSIYCGWRPLCDDVQHHRPAHNKEAVATLDTAPPPTHLRQAQPVMVLLPRTANWIASLPERVRPHALAAQYGRIANLLCAAWADPPACRQYFKDLLVGARPNRRGFPVTVLRELNDLQAYYIGMHDAFNQSQGSIDKIPGRATCSTL